MRGTTESGSVYYSGQLSITLKLINLEDGTVAYSHDYSYSGITAATGSTESAAITNTSEYLVAAMPRFIDHSFKVSGTILAIQSEKKGVANSVLIDLGSAAGVKEKNKFKVFAVEIVQGREMRSEVGALSVIEVGGVDISTAKVIGKDCGALIYKSFNEPGSVTLVLESVARSGVADGLEGFGRTLLN